MTKKDFELIAATLHAREPGYDDYTRGEYDNWETTVRAFADALRSTNKQFNRDKFLRACGVCPASL